MDGSTIFLNFVSIACGLIRLIAVVGILKGFFSFIKNYQSTLQNLNEQYWKQGLKHTTMALWLKNSKQEQYYSCRLIQILGITPPFNQEYQSLFRVSIQRGFLQKQMNLAFYQQIVRVELWKDCFFLFQTYYKQHILTNEQQLDVWQQKMGTSFFDQNLSFKGNFHTNRNKIIAPKKQQTNKIQMFARFERSLQRKFTHAKKRLMGETQKKVVIVTQKHQYEYKQFGDEPKIQFSSISLLLLAPILLRINLSMAQNEGIPMVQFLFVTFCVSFVFNLIFIVRKNRLMPYLPSRQKDNRVKMAGVVALVAIYCSFNYGWSASGGMIFAIIWQSLTGRQGCFYLIVLGGIIGGSIIMQLNNPKDFFLKIISSILFGLSESLIHDLKDNSPYAIVNQLTLILTLGMSVSYPFMQIMDLTAWQYFILIAFGFSMYFNLLLMVKLMQTQRVSMVIGVTSGIIIISATNFITISDYVACLTIVLSILVLLKVQYLDKQRE